ncbi:hypothetical protein CTheo_7316 [Ceratobasidium theobromae]|uniref:histone deacetylase n=1 Tax=Ceratobasidium theobromae TaxID=1582974 RepID=A0A5N5QCS5_9AGAM|nr:hypothetical protein CTheo_7316 [Ceratobasidium theobromae]
MAATEPKADFTMVSSPRVAYICSPELVRVSSLLPSNLNRSALVHTLVNAYGLLKRPNCTLVKPGKAVRKDLERYHEAEYLDYVLGPHNDEEQGGKFMEHAATFGLEDVVFPRLDEYIHMVAGATLTATKAIQNSVFDVAICWDGGRHHAHKGHAAGFCYVADCVLCILQLKRILPGQKERSRVAYLDLDLHHGDGVAEAFTSRSVNEMEDEVVGESAEQGGQGFTTHNVINLMAIATQNNYHRATSSHPFSLSIPLGRGTSSPTYARVWVLVERIISAFFCWDVESKQESEAPTYLVVQCGVDGLAGDPYAVWNWDIDIEREGSLGWCVQRVMRWVSGNKLKAVFLGGGGYNNPNAARAWACLTSIITGMPLVATADIPDHGGFLHYAPSFILDVPAGNMPDENTSQELELIENNMYSLIQRIQRAQQA